MTVQCLNQQEKTRFINHYINKDYTQKELAIFAGVSERTMHRVLVEAGLATPVARIKGEAHQVMQILNKHQVSVNELSVLLTLGRAELNKVQQELELEDYEINRQADAFSDLPF